MKKLTLIQKLVGCNHEDIADLIDEGFKRVGETIHIIYYRKDNQFALYDKRVEQVTKRFETRRYNGN